MSIKLDIAIVCANLHNVDMEKAYGMAVLRTVLDSNTATMKSISADLGVHPSHVSRIAAGRFKKMDGHALRVCKFALSLQLEQVTNKPTSMLTTELCAKVTQIASINPDAAKALSAMLGALIEQWSS